MSHDHHGGRGRAKSTPATNGTNGHLKTSSKRDGRAMTTPSVEESRQSRGGSSEEPTSAEISNVEADPNFEMSSMTSTNISPVRPSSNYKSSSRTSSDNSLGVIKEPATILEPPVTNKTLSELDVNKIVHNPKLRHDINFDPDLHFRPNLDGEKGRRKTEKTNGFYDTMKAQLGQYLTNRDLFESELEDSEWCLPATLNAIKGILETLVPQRDRSSVEETFNVELLMQQFRKGVADLPKLAVWLSQLLKCHCAPMRDRWVDEMVDAISRGDQERDVALLVFGMRHLLGVLEAMKLDVANHQIRCLRPLLIEDTVHFEQKFFMKKIAAQRVDIAGAHLWFKKASSLPEVGHLPQSRGNFWDFMKALVNLTLQSKSEEMVPHTFLFDEERLIKLRADIEDLINLEICMHMFRGLEANTRMLEARTLALDDSPVTSAPSSRPSSPAEYSRSPSPLLLPHLEHFSQKTKRTQERGHFRREPNGQQVWVPNIDNDSLSPSISASPRSSPSSTASSPSTYPTTPLYLSLPFTDSAAQVRSSLVAILASSTAGDRWTTLAPSLALQVLRSTTTPLTHLPQFESHLESHISNTRSRLYQEAEKRILNQLFPVLEKLVESYTPMTSLQIFEAATTPKNAPGGNLSSQIIGFKEEIEEVATRIAHIGTLHWRVWAPLAYLVDPDVEVDEGSLVDRAMNML